MRICKLRKVWEKLFRLTHVPLVSYGWHGNTTINNVLYKCCQMCNRHFNKTPIYSTPGLSCCTKAPVQAPNLYVNYRNKLYASTSCKPIIFILEQWQSTVRFLTVKSQSGLYTGPKFTRKEGNPDVHRSPFQFQQTNRTLLLFFFFLVQFLTAVTSNLHFTSVSESGTEVTRQY